MGNPLVFVCYCHDDSRALAEVKVHLRPLERDGLIRLWADTEINVGDHWRSEIDRALDQAGAAVLLISASFLASNFIAKEELPLLLSHHAAGRLKLLPVFLQPSSAEDVTYRYQDAAGVWRECRLTDIQGIASPTRTLAEMRTADRARTLVQLARRLRELASATTAIPVHPGAAPEKTHDTSTTAVEAPDRSNQQRIFISHSSAQRDWVEALGRNLEGAGHKVFIDRWGLIPGQNWATELDRELKSCTAAVLVVSKEAMESGWVREEIGKLRSRQTVDAAFPLIPVVLGGIEGEVPFLGDIHFVDFRPPIDYREAFARLIHGLARTAPGARPFYSGSLDLTASAIEAVLDETETRLQMADQAAESLFASPFVVVLARGWASSGEVAKEITARAATRVGPDNAMVLYLPLAEGRGAEKRFFEELMRQAGLDGSSEAGLKSALAGRLASARPLHLCVADFEHAAPAHRKNLCKILRELTSRFDRLRVVFLGGEGLQELTYGDGSLSVLTGAAELLWPEPPVARAFEGDPAWQHLPPAQRAAILAATGGDGMLARELLREISPGDGAIELADKIAASPRLLRALAPLARNPRARNDLERLAAQTRIAVWMAYQPAPLVRRLYWSGLAVREKKDLRWRSEAIRQGAIACLGAFA